MGLGKGEKEGQFWGGSLLSSIALQNIALQNCSQMYSHIHSLPDGVEGQIPHSQGAKSYPTFALWLGPLGFFPDPWFLNL